MDANYRINQMLYGHQPTPGSDVGYVRPAAPEPEPAPAPKPMVPEYKYDPNAPEEIERGIYTREYERRRAEAKQERNVRMFAYDQELEKGKLEDSHREWEMQHRRKQREKDMADFEAIESRIMGALTAKAPRRRSTQEEEIQEAEFLREQKILREKNEYNARMQREVEAITGRTIGVAHAGEGAAAAHRETHLKEMQAERAYRLDREARLQQEHEDAVRSQTEASRRMIDDTKKNMDQAALAKAQRNFQKRMERMQQRRPPPGAGGPNTAAASSNPFQSYIMAAAEDVAMDMEYHHPPPRRENSTAKLAQMRRANSSLS